MSKKETDSFGRRVLKFLCVLGFIILALLVAGSVYLDSILNKIDRFDEVQETLSQEALDEILSETDPEEEISGETLAAEEVTMPEMPAQKIEKEDHIVNILLIGQDRREGQGRQRSDAMILCTINTEEKSLVMTSFLRDLYVKLPEFNGKVYGNNRLNATYAIGGMPMLNDALNLNFGVDVDHNIEVDFSGFEDIIDLIGGVDIELTKAEAGWLTNDRKILRSGVNHLDGETALAYSRIRYLDSDFGRTNRQRTVLNAILNKVRTLPLTELTTLAEGIIPMITTDMTNSDIIKYVLEFFPSLTELTVTTQHIPAEGAYYGTSINGMSVLVPDFEKNIEILKDTIG